MRSSFVRAWVVSALFAVLLVPRVAFAFSAANIGATISALVAQKAAQLGISATDARIAATRSAMSSEAALLVEGESAASWAAAGVAGGIAGFLGGVPQPLADGSADQWTINKDGTLTITGNPHVGGGSVTSPFGALASGAIQLWSQCSTLSASCVVSGSLQGAAQAYAQAGSNSSYSNTVDGCVEGQGVGGSQGTCVEHSYYTSSGAVLGTSNVSFYKFVNGGSTGTYTGASCGSGMAFWQGSTQGSCIPYAPYNPPVQTQSNVSLATAISDLPASDEPLPLAQPLMADLANTLWQDAAGESGYEGIPYPATNPVTPGDVGTIQTGSPSTYPEVGDLVSPATDPATQLAVPDSGTGTGTGTGTTTGTGTGTSAGTSGGASSPAGDGTGNLCSEDPSAAACAPLGSASDVTVPASSVAVGLSPWSVGPSSASCPAPVQFEVFGVSYSVAYDPLCMLAEKLAPLVAAAGGLVAAMIVLAGVKS